MQAKNLLLVLTLLSALSSGAQTNYKPDSTFGNNAIFSDALPGAGAVVNGVASQTDGKVVVTGFYSNAAGTTVDSLLVMRLKTDGTRDSSFGVNGLIIPPGINADLGRRIKVDPDGRIVLATRSSTPLRKVDVTRLNADGSNDATFNGGNTLVIENPGFHLAVMTMVIQSTGKIVVCARKGLPGGAVDTMVFYRINTDGTVDDTYGTNGVMKYPTYFDLGNAEAAFEMTQDAADRLYVPTITANIIPAPLQVMRYTADGLLDLNYGTAGYSDEIPAENGLIPFAFTQLDNGMIAGAFVTNDVLPVQIINTFRWDTNGHTEIDYGVDGLAATPYAGFSYTGISYKTIANGSHQLVMFDAIGQQTGYRSVVMMDIDEQGAPDSAFGTAAIVRADQATAANATMYGVHKQSDGGIIAGTWMPGSHGTVIRFKPTAYAPTGIAPVRPLETTVYPNPAGSAITLDAVPGVAYTLYDATGRNLLQGFTSSTRTILPFSRIPAGTYLLVCTDGARSATIRVVKQ